jgi:hypothetical protein
LLAFMGCTFRLFACVLDLQTLRANGGKSWGVFR